MPHDGAGGVSLRNGTGRYYNAGVLGCKVTIPEGVDESFFQEIPSRPAVFQLRGDGQPYVSKTADLRRRLHRLVGTPPGHSKRLNLRNRVQEVEYSLTGSDFESQLVLYRVLRATFPKTYAKRLRLGPAPVVKLHLENEYPRASVTTRVSMRTTNVYYGPFPSRIAAEKFANDALDFFKMRRCVEDLHPDPAFPGCIYSEMKMCLAPCFKSCTDAEYRDEVSRVQAFFESAGESLTRELTEQRELASAGLAFEEAAAIHGKLEKLKSVVAQLPEIVRRIDRLQAIMVQRSTEPGCVSLLRFSEMKWNGPIAFNVELRAESESMESRLERAIADFPQEGASSSAERVEHLAILKRWYYRSQRAGEIFFADEKRAWPLRRIVRGIGRVYRGEKEQEPVSFSATRPVAPTS